MAVGLFISLYFWWKMGRDEHFDEIVLFDGYFLSLIIFLIVGRLGYVLMHAQDFDTLYKGLALLAFPGVSGVVGMLAAVSFTILFARSHGWEAWKVADAAAVGLSMVLVFGGLGSILNGSNPVWQINVWGMVWAIVTFGVVSRVRKNFRFYTWYKGESSMAQEGLASLIFGMFVGVYYLGIRQYLVGVGCIAIGAVVLYTRVGRRNEGGWSKLKSIMGRK
jgi:prolipoprotein diacylglyceryltransferase